MFVGGDPSAPGAPSPLVRWRTALLTASLGLLPMLPLYAQPKPNPPVSRPSPALRAAIRLFQTQQYAPAATELEALLQKEPQEPRVPYYLAQCYEKLTRPDDAVVQWQRARNLDPEAAVIPAADFQKLLDRLTTAAAQAHAQESKSTLAQAEGMIAKGDPITALSLLYDVRRLQPESAAVRYRIGLAYLALGWQRQALAAFEKAKQLDPNISFAAREEFTQKVQEAQTKAQPSPAPLDVARATQLLTQAKSEYAAGNAESALSHLLEARSADPLRAETYYQLGLCYFALERTEQARASLLAAQELDPKITFAPKEEFRAVMRKLGAPPTVPTAPPMPSPEIKPAKPLDFAGALTLMRHSTGGVFNFALKAALPVGGLEVVQQSAAVLNRQGAHIYVAILDSAMEMTAAQFVQRAADQLPLGRGRQIIALDESAIACASGDVPLAEVQSLLRKAQEAFRREPDVAALQLMRSLADRSLALRREGARRRLLLAAPAVLVLAWLGWHLYQRRAREEARLARLRARVEWMLYRAKDRLPQTAPAQERYQRAQGLFQQAAAAQTRSEALLLLSEALPLAEEAAREAEEQSPRGA